MLRIVVLLCVTAAVSSDLFDLDGLESGVWDSYNSLFWILNPKPNVDSHPATHKAHYAVPDTTFYATHHELLYATRHEVPFAKEIEEDTKLKTAGLLQKNHYPVETHHVTTRDGYILEMHRVPRGIRSNGTGGRPVVFLMHGVLSSSADWVLTGPGKGLAYILAEEGFDVWMGNARGNTYSRRHQYLDPNKKFHYFSLKKSFWQFSWDEIGNIDVPAMIDYVLEQTRQEKLHYIGHSQGTTAFFVMCSLRPEYNHKIISMQALGPVAYMAHNRNSLLQFIAPFSNKIRLMSSVFGIGEFLSNSAIMSWAGQSLCHDQASTQILCSNILFLIGGWNINQHNATILPSILSHSPAGASVMQLAHYGQSVASGHFRRYDWGFIMNKLVYGSAEPPTYNLTEVTAPVYLHYSASDPLAEVPDVDILWQKIGRPSGKYRISMQSFSHLDFVWGNDAKGLVYDRVIDIMWGMDERERPEI